VDAEAPAMFSVAPTAMRPINPAVVSAFFIWSVFLSLQGYFNPGQPKYPRPALKSD